MIQQIESSANSSHPRYWSSRLRLSPCMAGATLVAAGNGAPDLVMTALAPTTLESLHIVICDTLCWQPSLAFCHSNVKKITKVL